MPRKFYLYCNRFESTLYFEQVALTFSSGDKEAFAGVREIDGYVKPSQEFPDSCIRSIHVPHLF